MLLLEIRTNIHQLILTYMERKYELDKSKVYHLLTHHALKANQPFKAKDYSEQAGLVAMSGNADEEAVRFFNIALRMYEQLQIDDSYHLEILHVNLAEALYSLGDYSKAIEHFATALDLNGNPIPRQEFALRQIVFKMATRQFWKERLALKAKGGNLNKANNRRATQILERITQAAVLNGNSDLAAYCGFKLVELCETVEDPLGTQLLIGYSFCSYISLVLSKTDLAERYYKKALSTLINFKSRLPEVESAVAQTQVGMYAAAHGNWKEALYYFSNAKKCFKEYGERSKWRECTLMIGIVKHMQCDLGDCLRHFSKLLRYAQEDGDLVLQSSAMYWRCLSELLVSGPNADIDAQLNHAKTLNDDANFDTLSIRMTKEFNSFHLHLENKSQEMDDESEVKSDTESKLSKTGTDLSRERSGSFTQYSPLVTFAKRYTEKLIASPNLLWYNVYKYVHFLDLLFDGVEQLPPTDKKNRKALLKYAEQVLTAFRNNFPFPYALAYQKLMQGRWEYLENLASSAQKHWFKAAKAAEKSKMPYVEATCLYHLGITRTDQSRRDKALTVCQKLLKDHSIKVETHPQFTKLISFNLLDPGADGLDSLLDDDNSLLERRGTMSRFSVSTVQGQPLKKTGSPPSRLLPTWGSSASGSNAEPDSSHHSANPQDD
jgi:tetratricopeptide (TPR) repeat protein